MESHQHNNRYHNETHQQDNEQSCEAQPFCGANEVMISIEEKIQKLPPIAKECCIYRVPQRLFNINPSAYMPQVISIGPFYHGQRNLVKSEQHKLRFLDCYLCHAKICVNDAFDIARTWEEQARRCYAEPIYMNSKSFVEMMLVDGCFIVEYLIMVYGDCLSQTKNRLDTKYYFAISSNIHRDLIMLENQLPFFVLQSLFDKIPKDEVKHISLLHLVHSFLSDGFLNTCDFNRLDIISTHEVKHLVDLLSFHLVPLSSTENSQSKKSMLPPTVIELYASCVACVKKKKATEDNSESNMSKPMLPPAVTELCASCVACVKKKKATEDSSESNMSKPMLPPAITELYASCVACVKKKKATEDNSENSRYRFPPTVTELREAGVKIKKAAKEKSLMDISFKDGVLEIPYFEIHDCYETTVRNVMAYEHYDVQNDRRYVIQYILFLDDLISTNEDVRILVKKGIISNNIGGSNEEVAKLFNDLCKEVIIPDPPWHFDHISQDLHEHGEKLCNQWMASLRHNYCSTPWATISICAAIFLLILTFLQTVFSILSFLQKT